MEAKPPLSRVLFATDLSHDGDLAFAHALRIALAGPGRAGDRPRRVPGI